MRDKSTVFGQLIFCDTMGPVQLTSKSGYRYMIAFIDDYSRLVVVYFMRSRTESLSKFKQYCTWVNGLWSTPAGVKFEQNTGQRYRIMQISGVRSLQTDGAGELNSKEWHAFCTAMNISERTSSADLHENQAIIERFFRTAQDGRWCSGNVCHGSTYS